MCGVHLIARQTTRDMQQQQRFRRMLMTAYPNMRHASRQTFGQMQENFAMHGFRQRLPLVIHRHLIAAVRKVIAQSRIELSVDKHQPPGIQRQRVGITAGASAPEHLVQGVVQRQQERLAQLLDATLKGSRLYRRLLASSTTVATPGCTCTPASQSIT